MNTLPLSTHTVINKLSFLEVGLPPAAGAALPNTVSRLQVM